MFCETLFPKVFIQNPLKSIESILMLLKTFRPNLRRTNWNIKFFSDSFFFFFFFFLFPPPWFCFWMAKRIQRDRFRNTVPQWGWQVLNKTTESWLLDVQLRHLQVLSSSIQLQSIKEKTFNVFIWKVNQSHYVFYESVLVTRPTVSQHSLCKIYYSNQVQVDFTVGWVFLQFWAQNSRKWKA